MKNQGLRSLLYSLAATLFAAFTLALHAQSGSVDSGFDPAPNSNVFSAAIQVDGKIVVGGSFTNVAGAARNRIARLNANGTLDAGFNPNASGDINAIAVQADGRIVIGGAFTNVAATARNRIARLNADGTLDAGFNPNLSNVVNSVAIQPDGKIIIGGGFTNIGPVTRNRIARLNADGTLDTNFNPNVSSNVFAIALQLDGKILIGGDFTNVAATARNYFARLNTDGTLDNAFNPNPSNSVYNAAVQADGKIIIGGIFTNVAATARNRIARLNADGTLDTGFNPNASNIVNSAVLQADGKIIIGGNFTNVGGATIRNRIARLNTDGTLDSSFDPNAGGAVSSVALQADGKVIVGGTFTNMGAAVRTNLALLLNDSVAQSLTVASVNRIEWLRSGALPEAQAVAFEFSTDAGASWIPLGSGVRIAGGWELTGISLPANGTARGRARIPSGIYNGSSGLLEATAAFSGFTASAPLVITGNATNVSDVTASLTASINPAGSPTTAQFEYGTTTNYGSIAGITLSPTNGASAQNVIAAISGLTPGTNYHFRAVASNSVGVTYGSNQTFSTPLLPDIAVEHPTGTNLTDGAASISFGLGQVGVTNQPRTFIIRNVGLTNLTGLVITKDGTHSNDFTLNTNGMSTALAPGGSTTFSLVFTAAATGLRTAAVHIASSDPDENPFDIGLVGSGYQPGNVDTNLIAGANNTIYATAVQPDGKILLGGFFTTIGSTTRNRIARLNANGTLDAAFDPNATSGEVDTIAVQGDGKILVGGSYSTIAGAARNRIARLNSDGTIDAAFNPNVSSGFTVYDLAVLPDGKILVAGDFTIVGGATRNRIARLNADGTLDTNFNPNVSGVVQSMSVQVDGKIVIGGSFTTVGGVGRTNLARLNADGTVDAGLAPTMNSTVYCTAVQTDGKVLIGGFFTTVNGATRTSFARLNADGTLDSFNPAPSSTVYSMAFQADGKVIMAGNFTTIAATARNRVARFNTNGTLDTFNPDVGNTVYGAAIQPDGAVVLAGVFSTVGGQPRTNFARVFNDLATQTLTVPSANRIEWLRGGASPEAQSVTFDFSTDGGTNWVALGTGTRISDGWEMTGFTLPSSGLVRGRARWEGGAYNGSQGLTETNVPFSGFTGSAPLVATGGASNITDIAAMLYAAVNPAGAAATARVEYGTTTNYGITASFTLSPTNGATTQTVSTAISGLTPGTTYHYRVVASNSVGTTYGNDLTFDTLLYPDIVVEQPSGTNLLDGLSTNNFGFSLLGTTNAPRTFIIRNIGLTNLTGLAITRDGTHSNDFILDTNGMSTSIAPGASTTFNVIFVTGSTGTRTAAIHIANNDPDENPFDIALVGNGYRAGDLETNFNPSATGSSVSVSGLAIQPDGRMIVGGDFTGISGTTRGFLVRLNLDGTIDPAFTNANASVRTVVLQPDGKVLFGGDFTTVAGVSRNRIARLNANGTLDMTFSNTVSSTVNNMALQPDGKVLIGGAFGTVGGVTRLRLARLNADGSLDGTFVTNTPNQDVHALAVLPDGKIMIGGNFTTYGGVARTNIARLSSNGSLDTSFTNKITSAFGTVYSIVMQPDGKMLMGGDFTSVNGVTRNRFARFNTDDTLDSLDLNANGTVYSVALQTDGKILAGGSFFNVKGSQPRNYIARLNADGTLDSFNPNSGSDVYGIAIQPDGKIVVGGFFTTMGGVTRNRIARLWNDGVTESFSVASANRVEWLRGGALMDVPGVTFDFSTDGGVNWIALGAGTPISGGWELTGLSLPTAGQVRARARTFSGRNNGSSGLAETNAAFSGFTPAAPIVLTTPATSINVLSATLNASINPSGLGTTAQFEYGTTTNYGSIASVTLSPTNGATAQNVSAGIAGLTGGTTYHFRAIASNSVGITFGSNVTFATLTQPEIAVEQPAGINLTSGVSTVSFGTGMVANAGVRQTFVIRNQGVADLTGLAITKDGAHPADFTVDTNGMSTTVAAGASTTFTVTFAPVSTTGARTAVIHIANNDSDENPFDITLTGTAIKAGDLDSAFNPNSSDFVRAAAVQADGKIVINGIFTSVGGTARTNLARLNADGTPDAGFNPAPNSSVDALTLESSRKILVGGFFTNIGAQARNRIARLNIDGSADAALNSGANNSVNSIVPQPDGKLILCGSFTNVAGLTRNRIARLNADGTVDTNFNANADSSVTSALVQSDGKIIVWGNFGIIGGMARNRFARLNADGTADGSYNPASDSSVACAALQPDGKVLVGGQFANIGGAARTRIARLNTDGTADASFTPIATELVNTISIQTDGKILAAGDFTSIAGAGRTYIARLQTNGTIDTIFNSSQGFGTYGIALQPDGKIIITGSFTIAGGQTRNRIARLLNDSVSQTLTVASASRVEWLRSGASPEAQWVRFDLSLDGGTNWLPLGAGTRIGGGWELTALSLPGSGQVRAQACIAGGSGNVASWMVEAITSFSGLPAPEIAVEQPAGTNIGAGNNRNFGSVLLGGNASLTFSITNSGTTNLSIVITKDGTHASDFTVDTNGMSSTVAAGASTTFTVTFAPGALGARSAAIHIANNDADENPFDITLSGSGIAPEIVVEQPAGTNLTDGAASIDFGLIGVGVSGSPKTFTISNAGGATLSGIAVTKDGTNNGDFTVDTTGTSAALAPGASTTFAVTFAPSAAGTRNAAIHIASNDSDENPFDINLTGTGANQSPVVANAVPDQTARTGIAFSYTFPTNTFSDPDATQTLAYSATKADNSPLPAWLVFTPGTRTFSGTPGASDAGTLNIKVTATDNGTPNLSVSDAFAIVVITQPSVTTLAALNIGTFSASLRANINPNGLPTTAHFEIGEDTSYGILRAIDLSPDDGTTTQDRFVDLDGLQPSTVYHFRARATNAAGETIGNDLTFTTANTPPSTWRPAGPGSDGRPLSGTYFANANEGWAVGYGGVMRHTIDGGVTWTDDPYGGGFVRGMGGANALYVWVVGDNGYIGMWDGLTWSPQGSGVLGTLRGVWGADGSNAWAVGDAGTILKWNGSTWNPQVTGYAQDLYAVWGTDANNVWAVGANSIVLKWDGITWTASSAPSEQTLISIHGSSETNIWALGNGGTLFRFNGFSWAAFSSGTGEPLYQVYVADANNAWAAGGHWVGYDVRVGVIVRWNGTSWSTQTSAPDMLSSISGADANNVWAVGEMGLIMKWNGSSWVHQSHGAQGALLSVWGANANNIWAVGGYGSTITRWDGNAWTVQPSPVFYRLWGVWGSDVNNVWAVGEGGTIIKWNGSSWTTQTSGTSQDLWSIWGADANNVWAVGNFGTILKWNGSSWIAQSSPPGVPLRSVWGTDANNVWAAGYNGVIRKYNGTSWTSLNTIFNANDLYSIWVGSANNIWIGGFNGTRWKFNGASWNNYFQAGGQFVLGLWGSNPNNVWCAFGSTIQKWNGSSWTSETPNMTPFAFWGTGPSAVFAVGNDGMIKINADYRPSIATSEEDNVTSQGATLHGVFSPLGHTGTAVFQYGPDSRYGSTVVVPLIPNDISTVQNVSATLTGLAPSTFYNFRLVGANAFGRRDGASNGFWTLPGPDIAVEQPAGNGLVDGQSTVNLIVSIGNPPTTKTFTIKNTGTLDLTGLALSLDGPDTADFAVGTLSTTTLAPGASTTFTVTFGASAPAIKTAALHITSNDPNESPFDITLVGKGIQPEIVVYQPAGNSLVDGTSTVGLGEATLGLPVVKTFTVTNAGLGTLNVSGVTIDGTDAADFSTTFSATNLGVGGNFTFNVSFNPSTLGPKTAALHIANNDADEGSFDINLTGTGTSPEIVVEQPAGTSLVDEFAFIQFGGAFMGTSITRTFTVRNTGIGSLLGLSITKEQYGGGNDVHFSVGAFTSSIPPGASATFDVTFTPTTPFTHTATLRIFSTDADESPFDIYIQGNGVQRPEIVVEQPAGNDLVDGAATIDYGDVVLGAPVSKTFTVKNLGPGTLGAVSVFKDGANPEQFQATALPSSINSGDSATFTVTFNPTNAGSKSANIHIGNNDQDENPFDIVVTGNALAPEIVVEEPAGTNLENHEARAFGTVAAGSDSTLVFTIRNTGIANLLGLGITFTGANAADFSVSASPTAPVGPGGSTTFTVRFAPSTAGAKTAALRIANNDENENPFEINLSGTCLAPEIVVQQPIATNIADGGSKNFGSILAGGATNLTFTISNIGNANLTGLGITIDGANAAEFSVVASPVPPVIPGGNTSFTVRFAPAGSGARTAALHIANNDSDENPFDITLNGTAIANTPPALTRASAVVTVPVNTLATNSGTFSDVDGDNVVLAASIGLITPGAGTWSWTHTPGTVGSQTVTITADDGHPGGTNAVTFTLTATDVTPPTAAFIPVSPDPRTNAVGTVVLNFSENVSGVDTNDITLTRDGSPVSLAGLVVTQINASSYSFDLTAFTAAPGSYVLTLVALGSGIADSSSNPLSGDASDAFDVASSSSTVTNGNLSISSAPSGGDMGLTLRIVNIGGTNYLEIHDANNAVAAGSGTTQVDANTIRVPAASVTNQLQITGGSGDDHFVFDASNGCPLPPGGVNIDGGGQTLNGGDTLQIIGSFASVQYDANNVGAGNLQDDCSAVNFSGFEPVDYTLATIGDLAINVDPTHLFASPVTTTLAAAPGAGNEAKTRVGFSGGLELMDFNALTGTLTITGDSAEADTIVVQGMGTNFAGHLTIAAQAADVVFLTNSTVTLRPEKNFDVTAGSVTVGAVTVSGATVAFHGGSVSMNVGGTNQHSRLTVNGSVALNGNPTLNLTGSYVPQPGETFTLIDNDGVDAIVGAFAGLAEGASFSFNGVTLHITYAGGSGNDVVLSAPPPNTAPVLPVQSDRTVAELTPLIVTNAATDANLPADVLTYQLVFPPAGADINTNGVITWTPTEVQGPGTYTIITVVTDAGGLSATNGFTVNVTEVNLAPIVDALTNRSVNPGETIAFTATATDPDQPANSLSFSLVAPPPGATLDSNGAFFWRPTMAQRDTTNVIRVRAQDNGSPALSATNSFTVIVNPLAPVLLKSISYSEFEVSGTTGPDYIIMASPNLLNWMDIATNVSPAIPFRFNDGNAATPSNRFYKVRLAP